MHSGEDICSLIRNIYLYRGRRTSLIILDAPRQGKKTKKKRGDSVIHRCPAGRIGKAGVPSLL